MLRVQTDRHARASKLERGERRVEGTENFALSLCVSPRGGAWMRAFPSVLCARAFLHGTLCYVRGLALLWPFVGCFTVVGCVTKNYAKVQNTWSSVEKGGWSIDIQFNRYYMDVFAKQGFELTMSSRITLAIRTWLISVPCDLFTWKKFANNKQSMCFTQKCVYSRYIMVYWVNVFLVLPKRAIFSDASCQGNENFTLFFLNVWVSIPIQFFYYGFYVSRLLVRIKYGALKIVISLQHRRNEQWTDPSIGDRYSTWYRMETKMEWKNACGYSLSWLHLNFVLPSCHLYVNSCISDARAERE